MRKPVTFRKNTVLKNTVWKNTARKMQIVKNAIFDTYSMFHWWSLILCWLKPCLVLKYILVVKTCSQWYIDTFTLIAGDRDFLQKSKEINNFYWTHNLLVMAHIMLSQSISCPKTYQNVLQGCAYDIFIYDLQVNLWTWKFSRTGCRESRFLADVWLQCDSSD